MKRRKKDISNFTPLTDTDFSQSADLFEILTLYDRLPDWAKSDRLRLQITALTNQSVLIHLI